MPDLRTLRFDSPDETIPMGEKVRADLVTGGGVTAVRFIFEPGWRYTDHVDTEPCPAPHAGYIVSGRLHVVMDDGAEVEAGAGAVLVIEPGHDAWTVGDEPCVFVDFARSVTQFATP